MQEPSDGDLTPIVRERAYFLWEEAGRPYGREFEFWARASGEIETDRRAAAERHQAGRSVAR
ncbi:DUF2934 domain-containing protein [Aureimonas sp. AU4]|uniref:DUF2934 domain-containing protein n=1 Tax=Aureimonas sp. AU4 TaxID=1638163 RepID=UPI000782CD26|nr:DUF2934 domain-containing protein [Aureimonas sp. AU4]